MTTRVSYHPAAQAEFDQIFGSGDAVLELCLLMAIGRNDRIFDESKPLTNNEIVGKGLQYSTLYAVEYTMSMFSWVEYVYEELNGHVVVLAIDATLGGTPFVSRGNGDARQRARHRTSR